MYMLRRKALYSSITRVHFLDLNERVADVEYDLLARGSALSFHLCTLIPRKWLGMLAGYLRACCKWCWGGSPRRATQDLAT